MNAYNQYGLFLGLGPKQVVVFCSNFGCLLCVDSNGKWIAKKRAYIIMFSYEHLWMQCLARHSKRHVVTIKHETLWLLVDHQRTRLEESAISRIKINIPADSLNQIVWIACRTIVATRVFTCQRYIERHLHFFSAWCIQFFDWYL